MSDSVATVSTVTGSIPASNNHGDENVLDDLMQNNVQFDEDEKPKSIKKQDDEKSKHSDISDDESNVDSSDEKPEPKKVPENNDNDHSDISEDEADEMTKKSPQRRDSSSDENDEPEKNNSKNDHQRNDSNRKRKDSSSSGSDSDSNASERKRKKPALASRISRPEPVQKPDTSGSGNKKKKGKSYDYATKLNYLFRDARFFLIKSSVSENVELSKSRGVWSTPPANEGRFNKAFKESRNVLMLFSVKESGKFCGFARLASESRRDVPAVPWILPPGLSAKALGGVFKVDWICRKDLSFQKVAHLHNPWNENKPVKIGRDGQEIEPSIAEELCKLFPVDPGIEMTPILRRSKESARQQRDRPESERDQDVPHSRPLAERARPLPPNLSTRGHHPDSRKRSYREVSGGYDQPRPKYNRGSSHHQSHRDYSPSPHYQQQRRPYDQQPRPRGGRGGRGGSFRGRGRGHGGQPPSSVSRSYEDYLRQLRPSSNNSRSRPAQSYHDDYSYDRRSSRPSYDRSVDEFLRRNNERRYRDRR